MLVFIVLGTLAVAALVWSEWRENHVRLAAKPMASACFVTMALVGDGLGSGYGRWVLAGLVLAAIGDVALLWRSSGPFLLGLASFLFGHLAYVVAFVIRGLDATASVAALAAVSVPAFAVVRWLWPHVPDPMRLPVVAYAAVISLMVALAVGTVASDPEIAIVTAAIMFYLSDLAVARDRFVAPGPVNRLWGLPLYYAAQFVFAATVSTV